MSAELQTQLKELSAKLERKRKVGTMHATLQSELAELSQTEQTLKATSLRESADVDRLEKTTAVSIFYSILQKREAQLEIEKQEAYAAKLKYDAAARRLEDCRNHIEQLKEELCTLSDCQQRYNEVFGQLQKELERNPRYADKLCALERALGVASGQIKEADEAIAAGKDCMTEISAIEEALDGADGWGTLDVLGGGLISDLSKYSYLDKAQEGAERLQVLLGRFKSELADVKISADLAVTTDDFLRFADYFFDGLIADWCVLSSIHDTQDSISRIKNQVCEALVGLEKIKVGHGETFESLTRQLTALISGAAENDSLE